MVQHGTPGSLRVGLAFFDAEELGARGSRSLARSLLRAAERGHDPLPGVINVDNVARVRDAVWVEASPAADALVRALDEAGRMLGVPLVLGPVASDNRPFAAKGFPSVGVATGGDRGHLPSDVADAVQPEALVTTARLLLATLWALGGAR